MFQCDDYVIYSTHGVCRIVSVETRQIDRKSIDYFVLVPIYQSQSKFYIPQNNEAAVSKLRAVLSPDELQNLLLRHKNENVNWIVNEALRKNAYKELLISGDRDAILSMIIAVSNHQLAVEAEGKRIHACDENFLKDAKKMMNTEFSFVLQIPLSEVESYVEKILTA